jgi:uroporphyrinogen-III synthase
VTGLPQIRTKYLDATANLKDFNLLILTSKEALKALQKADKTIFPDAVCVSKATADFAATQGVNVIGYANGYGKELFALIRQKYANRRCYFPHAKVVAFDMVAALQDAGITFTHETVYETFCMPKKETAFENGDIFIFTAPSTVACFMKNYGWQSSFKAVAIGKTTYEALPKTCEKYIAEQTTIVSSIEKARSLQC